MTFPNSLKQIKDEQTNDGCVAIITRTKNRPLLLARAFASVLSQKYENWHLYVVNDGGHKGDVEKLLTDNQSAFHGRVTFIHHETSLGMEAASNSALKQSRGEFLIIHDDDDSWHSEFLEKTVGFLNDPKNSGFAAVVTSVDEVNEKIVDGVVVETDRNEFRIWDSEIDFSTLLFRNLFPPISLLVRRSVVNVVGEFNHQLPVLGDWDYNIRILMVGDIGAVPERLAYYHVRRNDTNGIYGNSATAGIKSHQKYDVFYRNSNLRSALNANPEMLGVVQALGRQIHETRNAVNLDLNIHFQALNRRLDLMDAGLKEIRQAVFVMPHFLRKLLGWVYGLIQFFRKMIPKFSKKA